MAGLSDMAAVWASVRACVPIWCQCRAFACAAGPMMGLALSRCALRGTP